MAGGHDPRFAPRLDFKLQIPCLVGVRTIFERRRQVIDLTWLSFVLGLTILSLIYVRLLGDDGRETHK